MNSIDPREESKNREEEEMITESNMEGDRVCYADNSRYTEKKKMQNLSDLVSVIASIVNREGIAASYGVADYDIAKTMCTIGDFLLDFKKREEENVEKIVQSKIDALLEKNKLLYKGIEAHIQEGNRLNEIIEEKDGIIEQLSKINYQPSKYDLDDDSPPENDESIEKEEEIQELAELASDLEDESNLSDTIILEMDKEIHASYKEILRLEEDLIIQRGKIKRLSDHLKAMEKLVDTKVKIIEKQDNTIRHNNTAIKNLREANNDLQQELDNLKETLEEKDKDKEYWKRRYYDPYADFYRNITVNVKR